MEPQDLQKTLSAPYCDIPLVLVEPTKRSESIYGQVREINESDTETRPFIVYEFKDESHETYMMKAEVRSHLRSAVLRIMDGFPSTANLDLETDPLILKEPFLHLVTRADRIFSYHPDNEAEEQGLRQLRYFLSTQSKAHLETFRLATSQDLYKFDDLWAAYVPGEFVVEKTKDHVGCYKIVSFTWDAVSDEEPIAACTIHGE